MKLFSCVLLSLSILTLSSCGPGNLKPDPDMMKFMEEVVNRYQGKLSYSYGVSASSSKGNSKYVELTLEESQLVNSTDEAYKQVAAGGIAYTFYSLLEKAPRFTDIKIVIRESDGKYEYSFPLKDLKAFDSLQPKFEAVMESYDSGEFDTLVNLINDGETDSAKREFKSYLKEQQIEDGPVRRKSSLFGFAAYEKNGRNRMVACYRVFSEKKSRWLDLYMDLSGSPQKVVGMKFLN